ncbi:hypothetical protein MPH_07507, partial [Macrophomina phaseolina MS6]
KTLRYYAKRKKYYQKI